MESTNTTTPVPEPYYRRLERTLLVLGGTLLASLVILAALNYRLVWAVVDAGRWVSHTQEVRAELEALLGDLVQAETSQRGYILTGDAAYLDTYREALAESRERYVQLRALTADNPRQQARFPALEKHIAQRLALIEEVIAAMGTSPEEAIRIVRTNRGREEMASIRALVGDMRTEETRLLAIRSADLEEIQRRTFGIMLFVIAATGAVMILLLVYLRFNIQRYHQITVALTRVTAYKDLLLKELHHRLNNVLQLIYSILRLQSRGLVPDARRPFEASMRRVRAVGRAHEPVYGAGSASDVSLRSLVSLTLQDALLASARPADTSEIIVDADDAKVGIDMAVPIGLIISEVAAALAAKATGIPVLTLAAKVVRTGDGLSITISHNVPDGLTEQSADEAAMLVKGLAGQLGAQLSFGAHAVRITLTPEPVPESAAARQAVDVRRGMVGAEGIEPSTPPV